MKRHARSDARENAMKYLYSEIIKEKKDFNYEIKFSDKLAKQMYLGVLENKDEIDAIIEPKLKKWSLKELNPVVLSILYIAIYEMKFEDKEEAIAINEALELSKKYCDIKSKNFIHSILGLYLKDEDAK